MKNKKLFLLITGIVILLGVATGGIIAWLTDTDTTAEKTFTVGQVVYTWTEGAFETDPVVPGQQLVASNYKLTNASTVDSELRVSVSITYEGTDLDAEPIDGDALDEGLFLNFALANGWELDDEFYYYEVAEDESVIVAGTQVIDVLTSLVLDGSKVGNNFRNAVFTITLTFEAKQADYVIWAQLGSVSFELGI